jgi:hypothetical protein
MKAERFLPWNQGKAAFVLNLGDMSVTIRMHPENGGRLEGRLRRLAQ